MGLEGVVSKRLPAPYRSGRAADWLKVKNPDREGIVSKRLSAPYRSGPSRDWIKIKNRDSPATIRARDAEW
jgi:ATP-dependent DNA ligase